MLYIFDWDGTLVDSVGRIVHCLKLASRDVNLPLLEDEQYQEIIGLGLVEAVNQLYPETDGVLQASLRESYSRHFIEGDQQPCPFFEGVEKTLSELQSAGHQIAIATGKSRRGLNRVLAQLEWHDYFHATRCADETASKPHPLMLQELLLELNTNKNDAIMVGDTEFDLMMANNAGIKSIGVSYGAHPMDRLEKCQPHTILHNFEDLLKAI